MILFLVSLFLVMSFAFLCANLLDSKNVVNNIIYFFAVAFANIVLTFEVLSLLSKISVSGVLAGNILLFITILIIWFIKGRPLLRVNFYKGVCNLKNALLQDKILLLLSCGFLIMISCGVFISYVMPANDAASLFYHVVRCLFWIEQGNFNHFNAPDARMLCFPINSEILYTWLLIFIKKNAFLGFFSIAAFGLYLASVWGIFSKLLVSLRARLWVIFVVSAFTAVITYLSSTETNIMVVALSSASIYLLLDFNKKHGIVPLYMASLAMALSIGVKTSALFLVPAVIIWYAVIGLRYSDKKVFGDLGKFIIFLSLNFLIFSSYNYILNFINYGDFFSVSSLNHSHKNQNGIIGFLFNLINYFLMMFNFSEYDKFFNCSDIIFELKKAVLQMFPKVLLMGQYSNDSLYRLISASRSGLGVLGILVFVPCLIISFIRMFFIQNKREFLINSFSIIFLISFLLMSASLVYMSFNVRFIVTFALICAPVIYHSYNKNFSLYKLIIVFFAMFSFLYVSFNITNKKISDITKALNIGISTEQIRRNAICTSSPAGGKGLPYSIDCSIRDYIKKFDTADKFLYFAQEGDGLLVIKELLFEGYQVDVDLIENAVNIDFGKYNYVITFENRQTSNLFHNVDKIDDGVFRKDGIFCVYNEPSGNLILEPEKQKPYISFCNFEDKFFEQRGLVLIETLKFSESFGGENKVFMYNIYKTK